MSAASSTVLLLAVVACVQTLSPPVPVEPVPQPVSWMTEVRPILERCCAVCHSCYNAPCQLKLSSYEGVDRGGSKAAVCTAHGLETTPSTRQLRHER
ncbi:MAG: peptidylprolyl isomerase, partial [Deltaproteobacteria bacterium]|nr:peptidylprolyl isomerase [Deltaproteobacteria bacterium]